ncbi:MAG: choice-of-anchor Q domain-containing protein [Dokdonella sp.]
MCGITFLAAAVVTPHADATNGVVGPGNCNESGFVSVLSTVDNSGGGTITFNCGTATIPFTFGKQIAHAVTIDGGGTITFDGANTSGFFQVFFGATVTMRRLTFQHGAYTGGVRAIENFGTLTLDHVRVINNVSTLGPVLSSGTLFVNASTFSGNSATSAAEARGGAIQNNFGDARVNASTFSGNSSAHFGGAVYSNSALQVVNSTFNTNAATGNGGGGGAIYQTGSGDSTVDYTTIVGNTATTFGAGLYNADGGSSTLTISRSIVSGNATGNCDGVLATGGYNLSNGTSCGGVFTGTGDLINQSLSMGALANNGGPTQTMLPVAGNPAINHIPTAQCLLPVDQRSAVRPFGAGCDSGAVEVGGSLTDLIFYDGFE